MEKRTKICLAILTLAATQLSCARIRSGQKDSAFVNLADVTRGFAESISETGLVEKDTPSKLVSEFQEFEVRVPLWSDGAQKSRYVYIPPQKQITYTVSGGFSFPQGTILAKHFRSPAGKSIETRFMVKKNDDSWGFASYLWNNNGTQTLAGGGRIDDLIAAGQSYIVPTDRQCKLCHNENWGVVRGLIPEQLDFIGSDGKNQLTKLIEAKVIANERADFGSIIPYQDPYDAGGSIDARARTYLDVNCAACHNPSGEVKIFDLSLNTPLSNTKLLKSKYLSPGNVANSYLYTVISSSSAIHMPPTSAVVDNEAVKLFKEWIDQLPR